jgi:hypothetical protein
VSSLPILEQADGKTSDVAQTTSISIKKKLIIGRIMFPFSPKPSICAGWD